MSDQLTEPHSQLDRILHKVPLGILLTDDQFSVVEGNSALADSLGLDEGSLRGACLLDLIHPRDRSILSALSGRVQGTSEAYPRAEMRLLRKDQQPLWVEIRLGLIHPEEGLPGDYLLILQEIQQRKEMELEVVELHRRLNDQVEEERVQLAQDLHDGPMQDLHSIQYQLAALQSKLPEEDHQDLENILATVDEVRRELRTISYDLRPPALSRFGLAKSIRSHAEEFVEKHPEFHLTLDLVEDGNLLSEDIRLALFRIYQQALGNILQHAEADEIMVSLAFKGNLVEMRVEDNGRGFAVPKSWISLVRANHFGLAGSHDRVSGLGGKFEVNSSPGEGTTLLVRIPDVLEDE